MSKSEERYQIKIAKSDKKARTAVDSFKVRKSGNSSIVTVPNIVKETLGVTDGEEIQYITIKDQKGESVVIMKKSNKEENTIDEEVEDLLNETLKKYDSILQALAEL